jgi:hypothetical protein
VPFAEAIQQVPFKTTVIRRLIQKVQAGPPRLVGAGPERGRPAFFFGGRGRAALLGM